MAWRMEIMHKSRKSASTDDSPAMSEKDDAMEDDTLPVKVRFSLYDEADCDNGDIDVYHCKVPNSVDESLFADFLLSLVTVLDKRDNDSFLEFLDPSAALIRTLIGKAQYRTELDVGDAKVFQNVREKVGQHQVFRYLSIKGNIVSLDILINSENDPTGELRKTINRKLREEIATEELLSDDERLSAEIEASETLVETQDDYHSDNENDQVEVDLDGEIEDEALSTPDKPCYFPSQIEMAAILKKRIDTIMEYYHNIAKLSDAFDDVDFVVYTARYKMLSDQTEKRIRHPHAGVLPRRERGAQDESCEEKRMFMYIRSADTEKNHEDLQKKISENPRTLFVIIADECHWGITKGGSLKPSAHNLFINEWCKDNPPRNVIVVQVSATPFNLLTRNSRLPAVKCALVNQTTSKHQAGDLMVLNNETGLPEQEPENSKKMELHVAHWSEVELKNFETGMRMKLKSALQTEDLQSRYLSVSANGKLHVTSSESEANEFIVYGSQGIVIVRVLAMKEGEETKILTIARNDDGTLKASAEPKLEPATFEVKLEFGVGIVAFCWMQKRDHYIGVSESGDVTLQTARVERECGVSIMKPKEDLGVVSFEFYISSSAPLAVKEAGHQYLSLNYYLSTVNCTDKQERKIREDKFLQNIVDKAKRQGKMSKTDSSFPVDALLCADYCYNILHRSVYKDEEKIRLRLVSRSENDEFEGKLSSFLAQESKEPEKYFPRETFEFVQKELCNKVTEDYNKALKPFQDRKHKSTSGISKEDLTASYVACLMHLPNKDLHEMHKKTPTNIMNELQSNDLQTLLNIWADIVGEGETSSMVTDLISSRTEKGKMKILRAKSMETANKFFYTLRLARKVSGLADSFEVIRDYGGMQIETQMMKASSSFFQKLQTDHCRFGCGCKRLVRQPKRKTCGSCQHVHKHITQYEDLENLACVLILVDKGRMGDTFPQSFNCLDLRLSYDSNKEFKEGSAIFLSSLIQELGRMCRYVKMSINDSFVDNIPCALVGRALFKALEVSLTRSPAVSAISGTKPDRYMTRVKKGRRPEYCSRWLNYEASKDSFDHGNEETYCNRILLQAEPQIGKTGTYLCLIKQLRDDILQKQEPSAASMDGGSFFLCKESDSPDELDVEGQDWQFPFWKTVQDSPSLLERPIRPGKYSIGGCFYTHDMEESPFILMKESGQKTVRSSFHRQVDVKEDVKQVLRAWHWHHFENCAECGRLLQGKEPVLDSIEVDISGTPITVKYSLPTGSWIYRQLGKKFKYFKPSQEAAWGKLDNLTADGDPSSLPNWIFHPSHRGDPRKCTLNYHHVMQENGLVKNHIQAVVVRSDKFEEYKSTWGKVLVIFELPEKLPDCEIGPSEGGVGYARLFIQKMAFALKLEYIFVIDDNVAVMSEAVFSRDEQSTPHATVVRDGKNVMTMKRCSFVRPLSHLRRLVQGKEVPPRDKEQYEPWKVEPDARQYPLYSYTGPAKLFGDKVHESYGVLGFLRSVPNVVRPFAKTQVYAAILLNVKSTVEKSVFYRPWPCWEDLRFNDDCDKAGLWVVKFNRYGFLKLQFKDWINDLAVPGIFEWKEDTTLEERQPTTELPKDLEERIVLQCIGSLKTRDHDMCFKGRVGCCENECEDAISPEELLEKVEAAEYNDDTSPDGVQVLVLSYALDLEIKDLMLLDSLYCKTKTEKIVFVISADEAKKKWPSLNLGKIKSDSGLRFTKSMRKRKATFAMFSAADPRRHKVRLILIEVSFQDGNREEEEHGKSFEERGTSSTGVRETHDERMSPERSLQDTPFRELEQDSVDAHKPTTAGLKEEGGITDRDGFGGGPSRAQHLSFSPTTFLASNVGGEGTSRKKRQAEEIFGDHGIKIKRKVLNNPPEVSACMKPDIRSTSMHSMGSSSDEEFSVIKVETKSSSKRTLNDLSYSTGEVERLKSSRGEADYKHEGEDCSTTSHGQQNETKKRKKRKKEKKEKKDSKSTITGLTPEDPAYMEGTNSVTKAIVDLWREDIESRDEKKEGESSREEKKRTQDSGTVVQNKLKDFQFGQLEETDGEGYNALLKASSLPTTHSRLMQYLIKKRKVDINCQLPPEFNRHHTAASDLVPGMSALSVAIRRGNVKSVPTFKNRVNEIDVRSTDAEGNTALHHCILSSSKSSFAKLFPLFKPLEWRRMRNQEGQNPFEMASELRKSESLSPNAKGRLESILDEMDKSGKWRNNEA